MAQSTRRMQFTDSGFAWIVTAMSFFVLYAVNSNFISLGPLLPDLLSHFQVSQAMLGMLASVRIVICDAASGTLVGPLVRKLGCRPLVMVGLALSAAGYVAAAFVDDYYIFLLMFSVIPGLGLAGAYIPSNVIVHQYHSKGRALASGLSSVGLSFSTFTFPVLMRLTIRSFGWRASLVMLAAIQVQMVAAAMIFMPNPDLKVKPTQTPIYTSDNIDNSLCADKNGGETPSQPELNKTPAKKCNLDCSIFKNPAFLLFLFAFPFADCGGAVYVTFALQRAVYQGINPLSASLVLSVFGLCSVVGRASSGFIANLKCTRRAFQAAGCVFAAGVVTASSMFAGSSLLLHSIFAGCFGFMNGAQHSLYSTLLVDIIGLDELARGMGIVQMVKCAMAAVCLPIAGYLFDVTQNYAASFLAAGSAMVGGSILYACSGLANHRRKKSMPPMLE